MMRCSPANLVGRRIADLTPTEYQDRVLGQSAPAIQRAYETGILRPDGTVFLAELIGRAIRYEGRDARLTTFRDITERTAAAAALRASEARFAAFMDHSPAIAFIKDEEGRLVYVNRAFDQRFSHAQIDVIGKTDFDLWPAESRPAACASTTPWCCATIGRPNWPRTCRPRMAGCGAGRATSFRWSPHRANATSAAWPSTSPIAFGRGRSWMHEASMQLGRAPRPRTGRPTPPAGRRPPRGRQRHLLQLG